MSHYLCRYSLRIWHMHIHLANHSKYSKIKGICYIIWNTNFFFFIIVFWSINLTKILVLLKKRNCKKEIFIVRLYFTYGNYIKLNLPKFIFNWMAAQLFWTGLIAILAMDCRLILLGWQQEIGWVPGAWIDFHLKKCYFW